ncbi:hypothetical protein FZC83_07185 [Rossellomorea marisflavi]|uniref:Uncharacterized protein n=1 Tax=Rossellomorea marisflavi TaxID=189381 RepID=A0A5D4RYA0_9BACI|nr:hypothetical protein [Rossellomorea marisflavi]TYS54724.1 hypothetical protein FZC83_07185 [Rossellomorea marisflavi]
MKEILKHPTVSAILGTVIGTIIVTPIVAYINNINVIEALRLIINWIKNIITLVLSFQVPFWIVLVALFIFLFSKRIANKLNSQGSSYARHFIEKHYRQDRIDNILWIFEWYHGFDGKLTLRNASPHPICPNCMNDLVLSNRTPEGHYSNRSTRFTCENCGFSQKFENDPEEYILKIKREIIRRIRTGEWRDSLQQHSS